MSHRAVCTEDFVKCLDDLQKRGGPGKRVWKSALAAMSEFQIKGRISPPVTRHGESRLPNITKYDLGENNHRLVVQRIEGQNTVLVVFLFVGPHEATQRWLDNHR